MSKISRHKILFGNLFPFTFIVVIWLVQLAQGFLQQDWGQFALQPRHLTGLIGILTAPLLHAGWEHLIGNTLPLLILSYLLFNSYKEIAGKVFWISYFLNGILLWFFARDAFHLGASGVVYALASFLMISGLIRKHPQLAMISFLVIFLYGSMVWGVFPFDPHVSWEAHLYGGLTGLILAFVFRKEGPQPKKYFQEEEEEENALEEKYNSATDYELEEIGPKEQISPLEIVYSYRENSINVEPFPKTNEVESDTEKSDKTD
ncbi:rhomboid family intramembrane serine protease [soil metagenome]